MATSLASMWPSYRWFVQKCCEGEENIKNINLEKLKIL